MRRTGIFQPQANSTGRIRVQFGWGAAQHV
jgi:hypothetical protein